MKKMRIVWRRAILRRNTRAKGEPINVKKNMIPYSIERNTPTQAMSCHIPTCKRISRRYTNPTEKTPESHPSQNRPLFHWFSDNIVTPYPQRYIGKSAIQNAENERRTFSSMLFVSSSYLIGTEFPWTPISLSSWTKSKGHEENIDSHKEKEKSDEVCEKLRISNNEDTKKNREKSEKLHKEKVRKTAQYQVPQHRAWEQGGE